MYDICLSNSMTVASQVWECSGSRILLSEHSMEQLAAAVLVYHSMEQLAAAVLLCTSWAPELNLGIAHLGGDN